MLFGDDETLRVLFGAAASVVSALAAAIAVMWRQSVRDGKRREDDLKKQRDDLLKLVIANGLKAQIPESVPRSALPGSSEMTW